MNNSYSYYYKCCEPFESCYVEIIIAMATLKVFGVWLICGSFCGPNDTVCTL